MVLSLRWSKVYLTQKNCLRSLGLRLNANFAVGSFLVPVLQCNITQIKLKLGEKRVISVLTALVHILVWYISSLNLIFAALDYPVSHGFHFEQSLVIPCSVFIFLLQTIFFFLSHIKIKTQHCNNINGANTNYLI